MVDKNLALLGPRAMKVLAEMRAIEAIAAIFTMLMFKLQREREQASTAQNLDKTYVKYFDVYIFRI